MRFSIISIAFETYREKEAVLASYFLQKFDVNDFEIILVDDGSSPPLYEGLSSANLRILYLERNEGSSRARARNEGAKIAKGDYLVFLDGDCIVNPQLLNVYSDYINATDREIVLGSFCNLIHEDINLPLTNDFLESLEETDPYNRQDSRFRMVKLSNKDVSEIELGWLLLVSRNFCISRFLFESLNGFDERFRGWGSEDSEFAYRLTRRGIPFNLIRNRVYHLTKTIQHEINPDKYVEWLRNVGLFYQIHEDPKILLLTAQDDLIYQTFCLTGWWDVNYQVSSFQKMCKKAELLCES